MRSTRPRRFLSPQNTLSSKRSAAAKEIRASRSPRQQRFVRMEWGVQLSEGLSAWSRKELPLSLLEFFSCQIVRVLETFGTRCSPPRPTSRFSSSGAAVTNPREGSRSLGAQDYLLAVTSTAFLPRCAAQRARTHDRRRCIVLERERAVGPPQLDWCAGGLSPTFAATSLISSSLHKHVTVGAAKKRHWSNLPR